MSSSFSADIHALSGAVEEIRASQEKVDLAKLENRTDPIEEGKVVKINKILDDAEERRQKFAQSKKLATLSASQVGCGIDDFLRGNGEMQKTIFRTKAVDKAQLSFTDKIQAKLSAICVVRNLASVATVSGESFEAVRYATSITPSWSAQGTAVATASQNFVKQVISTFDLTAQPQMTSRMIADAQVDVESYVIDALCDAFAYQETNAFFNGDGTTMPKGILSYPATSANGSPTITRLASKDAATISLAGIAGLYYSLPDIYAENACFIMHKSSVQILRTMKDAAGQYLWMPGVLNGASDTLLGKPLYTSSYMPQVSAGADVVIFGDIKKAYQVVDRGDILIQRDPFSSKPYVTFYTTKRVGGDVINTSALNIMKVGA